MNERANATSAASGNTATVLLIFVSMVLLAAAVLSGQSWRLLEKFSSKIPGREPEHFEKVSGPQDPPFLAVQAVLKAEGVPVQISDFQIHAFGDSQYKFLWQGASEARTYLVTKDERGGWTVKRKA
jgi:hypothetical protein